MSREGASEVRGTLGKGAHVTARAGPESVQRNARLWYPEALAEPGRGHWQICALLLSSFLLRISRVRSEVCVVRYLQSLKCQQVSLE